MQPGQADFSFEISEDARSLVVTTVDDPRGNNESTELAWVLEGEEEGDLVLSTNDWETFGDVSRTEVPIEYNLIDGLLTIEAGFADLWGQNDIKIFEVDMDDAAEGEFEVVAAQGGMMRCVIDE